MGDITIAVFTFFHTPDDAIATGTIAVFGRNIEDVILPVVIDFGVVRAGLKQVREGNTGKLDRPGAQMDDDRAAFLCRSFTVHTPVLLAVDQFDLVGVLF